MTAVNFLTVLTMWKLNLYGDVYYPRKDHWTATSMCVSDANLVNVFEYHVAV
jgi:hypothetical protein